MLSVAAIVRAFRVVAVCANPRALPRSLGVPAEATLSVLLRGLSLFTHECLVSPPLCCRSASTSCFVIMLALNPASSTPAPCPRSLFATLVTSRRRVHERRHRVFLFVVLTKEPPATLHTVTRDQSSHRSATPRKKALFAAFTTSASDTSMRVITYSRFTVSSDPSPCNNAVADT